MSSASPVQRHSRASPHQLILGRLRSSLGPALGGAVAALALAWVVYKAFGAGFGADGNVPTFIVVALNGLTLAGLYFIVASGFTLIFGLMRIVNLAHGSFYLLGGYIAYELTSRGAAWWGALAVAAVAVGIYGVLAQQLLLRWNQGQDLRQTLITIALSIVMADQMLAHFGGVAVPITPPTYLQGSVALPYGLQYPVFRLFVLGAALTIGIGLWLWINRTRLGMVMRAGVDDRAMAAALGVNVQLVFVVGFFVGALLAGLGGVVGGTMLSLAPGEDVTFLLSSLIVVIIGGMGSLAGAAVGALALGLVDQLSDVYLPASYTNYSILLTFALLVLTLAVRPLGFFGKPEHRAEQESQRLIDESVSARRQSRLWVWLTRTLGAGTLAAAALVPVFGSTFFTSAVGLKTLWLGLAASSLIFLSGYGGMISLAQTALYGIAGFTLANLAVKSGVGPWEAALAGLAACFAIGLIFGAIGSRSEGIYFIMITLAFAVITYFFFSQVTSLSGHEGINDVPTPKLLGDPVLDPARMYYAALGCSTAVYLFIRYLVRTPFGLALQGVRDDPVRMRSLGFNVQLQRTAAFGVGALIAGLAGVFSVWSNTRISPGSIDLTRTIDVLAVAVVGGLFRLEGAWIGALLFTILDTYTRGATERFQTWIGLVLLVVILLSPGGIAGLLSNVGERLQRLLARGRPLRPDEAAPSIIGDP